MAKGYHQVMCDDESIPMTGFVTLFGFFRWQYMPFGLRNAPATFSRLVCKLVLGCESFCVIYLDDVLIFSDSVVCDSCSECVFWLVTCCCLYGPLTSAVLAAYVEFQSETPAMEFRAPGV